MPSLSGRWVNSSEIWFNSKFTRIKSLRRLSQIFAVMPVLKWKVKTARMLLYCCLFLIESEEVPSAFYYFQALLNTEKALSAHRSWSIRDKITGAMPRYSAFWKITVFCINKLSTWRHKIVCHSIGLLWNTFILATKCCLWQPREKHIVPRVGGCHQIIIWCIFTGRAFFVYSVFVLT